MGVSVNEEVYFSCPNCGRRFEKVRMFSKARVQCQKCHHSFSALIKDGVVVLVTLPDDPDPEPRLHEYIRSFQEAGESICQKADQFRIESEIAREERSVNDELPLF